MRPGACSPPGRPCLHRYAPRPRRRPALPALGATSPESRQGRDGRRAERSRDGRSPAGRKRRSALGAELAQMVVGAPVAKAELQHEAVESLDQARRLAETGALRLETPDETVQSAHAPSPSTAMTMRVVGSIACSKAMKSARAKAMQPSVGA